MPHDEAGPFPVPLEDIEAAPPTDAVTVFAHRLTDEFGAGQVSFLIIDFAGRSLIRLGEEGTKHEQVPLDDEDLPYGRVVVEQQVQVVPDEAGARVLAPVTARGDAMGVLDLVLPSTPDEGTLDRVASAAHALAYVVTTERRHTDLYEWGQRTRPVSLAAEIQRQLLPDAFTCEAGQFTLAAWLEPASTVGGDTFDYALDEDRLFLSMTDAMGHDVDAAMLATLTVGSLRNSRRADQDLAEMAATAGRAIAEHRSGLGFVTGLLLDVRLDDGTVRVVNAGHPLPLLLRGGRVQPVELQPNLPLGVLPEAEYAVQEFALEPGDRLVLLTDGMQERNAHDVDLEGLLVRNADVHPRQLMQILTSAVQEAVEHGQGSTSLADDATALCLQWHGSGGTRRSAAGASSTPR